MIGEQKTLKNKTLGESWGVPVADEKNRIAYTTAIFWWFRWRTKKWNCLYYGEILVVPMNDQKVELPILRRDCGGSDERPKSEIVYTTVRSWWLKK